MFSPTTNPSEGWLTLSMLFKGYWTNAPKRESNSENIWSVLEVCCVIIKCSSMHALSRFCVMPLAQVPASSSLNCSLWYSLHLALARSLYLSTSLPLLLSSLPPQTPYPGYPHLPDKEELRRASCFKLPLRKVSHFWGNAFPQGHPYACID